jgi:hypothetical protein
MHFLIDLHYLDCSLSFLLFITNEYLYSSVKFIFAQNKKPEKIISASFSIVLEKNKKPVLGMLLTIKCYLIDFISRKKR